MSKTIILKYARFLFDQYYSYMTHFKNTNIDDNHPISSLLIDSYCQDEKRLQTLFDVLLDPHQSLSETIQKHLTTIKSYLSNGKSFEEFCKEIRKYNNNIVCGLVWTNTTISYRCRTCATNPCMSLCPDCFYGGNHDGHDANMFRSVSGGICDCGDITVMNSNGFCKHHGPNRISNEKIPHKLIQFSSIDNKNNHIECCICQSKDDENSFGLVVRLVDTGVLGIREINQSFENNLVLINNDQSSLKDSLTCCHISSKFIDNQQLFSNKELQIKNDLTCAKFYEEKIRDLLEIFSEKSVSQSITINWRTGIIINSCNHFIHLSCYQQYLKSHLKKFYTETDPHIEFKCPMCRQISHGLIPIPSNNNNKQIEINENIIQTITNLINKNTKPCISSSSLTQWIINLIQKIYLMINKNYRTINKQEQELNDDILALFLISILRFNLENDLLIRDTEHIDTRLINRKICFRELFYICSLKYPYLSTDSHILLWYRITGLINHTIDQSIVPLLLSDPIVLLLQIILSLPYLIPKEFYQVIVQALFNLTYIQSLFTIVTEMNKNEQIMWSNILTNQTENYHLNSMTKYLRIIALKLSQANFYSDTNNSEIRSLESINASIHERCGNFIKIAGLIQHHLYQSIIWWIPSHLLQFDILWKNLIKELQLYDSGEPYWFCNDSLSLILQWLNEILIIDEQKSKSIRKIVRQIPLFHSPQFIKLPTCYSDLLRLYTHLHCTYCRKLINEPILCLICGIIYPQERLEQKCCDQQTNFMKEHLMKCSGGLNLSININSTKTLIQRERRYTYWSSLYLDQHGEEDFNLKRGRILYLNENRLKLLYSAWISSNLDQLIHRWATDQFDF